MYFDSEQTATTGTLVELFREGGRKKFWRNRSIFIKKYYFIKLTLSKPKQFCVVPLESSSDVPSGLNHLPNVCSSVLLPFHIPRCKTGMRNRMKLLPNCL